MKLDPWRTRRFLTWTCTFGRPASSQSCVSSLPALLGHDHLLPSRSSSSRRNAHPYAISPRRYRRCFTIKARLYTCASVLPRNSTIPTLIMYQLQCTPLETCVRALCIGCKLKRTGYRWIIVLHVVLQI
ncbi:hypothetical protein FIBSPDRAFT_67502 [Athelia psychrophila]|uniref:Uncharacterized protein n=1 Tax=Athelia psychrophila TaxID=1759441 RepID=A0A166EV33_9AGAM|nr:hypothetical protein FIBSPDRAFT_67502 [Fibularhizoctonia sp. CBS 109695]